MDTFTLNNGVTIPQLGFGVFQTPPEAAAEYISFPSCPPALASGPSATARSTTRPLVTAGPIGLHANSDRIVES